MGIPRPIARSIQIARRFSALVEKVTVLDAILYKRWLITRVAAGKPTPTPMMKRDAVYTSNKRKAQSANWEGREDVSARTNVAPNRSFIFHGVVPND
jgi:hypothetical protein